MHSVELEDPELAEAASLLQQQLVYNGEVLDISVDALRAYKEGVQSLRYLDSSVRLGYSLLRMLEKWSRERGGGELLVRKKKARRRRKGKGVLSFLFTKAIRFSDVSLSRHCRRRSSGRTDGTGF